MNKLNLFHRAVQILCVVALCLSLYIWKGNNQPIIKKHRGCVKMRVDEPQVYIEGVLRRIRAKLKGKLQ